MTNETLTTTGTENTDPGEQQNATDTSATTQTEGGSAEQQTTSNGATNVATSTEQKTEGAGEGKTDDGKGDGKTAAPETYEFTPPEGITISDAVKGAYAEFAKEAGLTQEQAQKGVDKIAPVMAAVQKEALSAQVETWASDSKADKEFGGDNLDANLAIANRGLQAYGSPKLIEMLNQTGLGNHPEFIRTFLKIGKTVSEDTKVTGTTTAAPKTLGQRMFPNMK
jgi:hypothetical protein